ncbi:TonB family protein [Pseudomonas extremorientalis]|jgi:TonB family protein|uniref:TonB family C-terminal domain-containing protein n=1 Tax=Pseudomonas extremorientalis TaxID=169669 RepID=A0A1H0WJ90_9PSED|nr:TonB family protein [Pseudomonas extremorientalis]OIN13838.1 TonB-dependent outer membrane receptor [Pseudomonas extremorientalis]UUN90975.1 TonB family protein [Pseudomonas extremorientalis]WLG59117.1 TonB family protein [Pseudomonas extremorientalis]SDP90802.1 TonB family C-terminal domain-containing protein [Pseudomonas extremorientalis]
MRALVLLLLLAAGRAAQAESPLLPLNLPAQDLEHALQAYSRATGMAVLVDRELTRGRRSIAVRGRFTAQEALAMLLTGSGLMARYARSDAFTLQTPQVSPPPTTKRGAAARNAARINNSYATALQQAIETSLCRSPLTRPGSFRALVQVWVNPDGRVEHSRLVSSTGDEQRDEALVRSLAAARVERPAPSSLRQPVTLLLMPDTTGTRMECTAAKGASEG